MTFIEMTCTELWAKMMTFKKEIILWMFACYAILCYVDFIWTITEPARELNPVAVFWIAASGIPLNLLFQFTVISIPLMMRRTWNKIDEKTSLFFIFWIYMFVMIVSHIAGIMSWVC